MRDALLSIHPWCFGARSSPCDCCRLAICVHRQGQEGKNDEENVRWPCPH
jgi:hypothetical protein